MQPRSQGILSYLEQIHKKAGVVGVWCVMGSRWLVVKWFSCSVQDVWCHRMNKTTGFLSPSAWGNRTRQIPQPRFLIIIFFLLHFFLSEGGGWWFVFTGRGAGYFQHMWEETGGRVCLHKSSQTTDRRWPRKVSFLPFYLFIFFFLPVSQLSRCLPCSRSIFNTGLSHHRQLTRRTELREKRWGGCFFNFLFNALIFFYSLITTNLYK